VFVYLLSFDVVPDSPTSTQRDQTNKGQEMKMRDTSRRRLAWL
jgi:hypothetical protein